MAGHPPGSTPIWYYQRSLPRQALLISAGCELSAVYSPYQAALNAFARLHSLTKALSLAAHDHSTPNHLV
jgi:hypothetical protein